MKKTMVLLSILSMIVILIIGCSSGTGTNSEGTSNSENNKAASDSSNKEKGTDDVTIRYYTFSPGESHEKDLQAMIEAFEEKNPGIKVEYEMASYEDYFTKLQTQIAGGNAPDTFELNYENFVSYASRGALLELDSLISSDSSFDPSTLNQKAYEAFQYEGKQYGMVESFSNVVLFYNKDLFDAKNVEYPQPDWTWEDELEAAQKLTDTDNGVWGTLAPIQFWEFYKTIVQNGGSVFNEDKTEVTINSPENIETLQWMVDKISKYHVTPSEAEMSGQANEDLFMDEKIAMFRSGIWMFGAFNDLPFEWDIALEPGNTQKAHHFFANGLAVSKDTENAEASWKWIEFMSASKEAAQIRVDVGWELPAVSDKALLDAYLQISPPQSREVVFEALDTLVVPPVIEKWGEMTDMIGLELEKVVLGQKTPEQALADMETNLKPLLK